MVVIALLHALHVLHGSNFMAMPIIAASCMQRCGIRMHQEASKANDEWQRDTAGSVMPCGREHRSATIRMHSPHSFLFFRSAIPSVPASCMHRAAPRCIEPVTWH